MTECSRVRVWIRVSAGTLSPSCDRRQYSPSLPGLLELQEALDGDLLPPRVETVLELVDRSDEAAALGPLGDEEGDNVVLLVPAFPSGGDGLVDDLDGAGGRLGDDVLGEDLEGGPGVLVREGLVGELRGRVRWAWGVSARSSGQAGRTHWSGGGRQSWRRSRGR